MYLCTFVISNPLFTLQLILTCKIRSNILRVAKEAGVECSVETDGQGKHHFGQGLVLVFPGGTHRYNQQAEGGQEVGYGVENLGKPCLS